jgi:hypothetical protein
MAAINPELFANINGNHLSFRSNNFANDLNDFIYYYILGYLFRPSDYLVLPSVVVPSTLMTSVWTLLLVISGVVTQLLIPIELLRRFTTWWFRDVEKHPLTVIAKVAASLIIIGAVVIKVVRWI